MKEDDYDWWKRRFAQMSCYFDAFRIDHILGFFRIWSIPQNAVEGILGCFAPAIPVQVGEFAARGIPFNYERFTRPFINDAVVQELFGDRAAEVKCEFLNPAPHGTYLLKPEFAAQRDVEKYFASLETDPRQKEGGRGERREPHYFLETDPVKRRLKEGLFDLISNVLLIEAPGGAAGEFHFRLGMEQTAFVPATRSPNPGAPEGFV